MNKKHILHEYLREPTHPITVSVIGCGGTGSYVVTQLAKISVALQELTGDSLYVIVYDDDKVESHNVGRQLFSESDIGNYKAETIVSRVNRFYGLDWQAYNFRMNHAPETNIIITCTDNVKSRKIISKAFNESAPDHTTKLYWLDFGNSKDYGQIILSTIEGNDHSCDLPDIFDIFGKRIKDKPSEPSCSMLESLSQQDLFINIIMATSGINILWKLLINKEIEYHGLFINTNTGITRPIKIK